MLYTISLYFALCAFVLGSIYRIVRWFRVAIGPDAYPLSFGTRVSSSLKGLFSVVCSRRLLKLLKTFLADVLFQRHLLLKDGWRWVMHFSMFAGVLLLILVHALDDHITLRLFPDYYATLNPYLWCRNLFGALALVGIAIALVRRSRSGILRNLTTAADMRLLAGLALVLTSGFLLEAGQIISEPIFDEMVADYADPDDAEEVLALQAHWTAEYGVVFANPPDTADPALTEQGQVLNAEYCLACHARPAAAFVSYPLSRMIQVIATWANSVRLDLILWHLHYLACFALLAGLPFTKLRHIFTSSASLLVRSVEQSIGQIDQVDQINQMDPTAPDIANKATRRVLSLDACVNCGECSRRCSVAPIHGIRGNGDILPSHKLASLDRLIKSDWQNTAAYPSFQEGNLICTGCYRCTQVCPAGLDLQDLWEAAKAELASRGVPATAYRPALNRRELKRSDINLADLNFLDQAPLSPRPPSPAPPGSKDTTAAAILSFSNKPESFSACIQCGTCTNVCPVVADYQEAPYELGRLDLTPQQIVNTFRLGISERVANSKMAWDCFLCFKCQEHCPKDIPVAEMIYDLRNRAYAKATATGTGVSAAESARRATP